MAEPKSPPFVSLRIHGPNPFLRAPRQPSLSAFQLGSPVVRAKPPHLKSLCLEMVGKHLEDIIPDLRDVAPRFASDIKSSIAAIAKRRRLLNDDTATALADGYWGLLDISGSDVTDSGLANVSEICRCLRAVDISRCSAITSIGISQLIKNCRSLEVLRFGGCPRSDRAARGSLGILKPKLNDLEVDSWEELDVDEIADGVQSLKWLVWPSIDQDSLETLISECPRITVNPQPPSPLCFNSTKVPWEALPDTVLDSPALEDINPSTWAVWGVPPKPIAPMAQRPEELSVAEKFRLAFEERDTRLAPKREKNERQQQQRAQGEWPMTSADARATALAPQATKSLLNKR